MLIIRNKKMFKRTNKFELKFNKKNVILTKMSNYHLFKTETKIALDKSKF